MRRRATMSLITTAPVSTSMEECNGLATMENRIIYLVCGDRSHHKLAELHPGGILKIRDKSCGIITVFRLAGLIARSNDMEASA